MPLNRLRLPQCAACAAAAVDTRGRTSELPDVPLYPAPGCSLRTSSGCILTLSPSPFPRPRLRPSVPPPTGLGLVGFSQLLPKLQVPVGRTPEPSTSSGGAGSGQRTWSVRCPFDFSAPAAEDGSIHGVQRVSRHAALWSFAAVCLGSAVVVPSIPQAACLAGPTMVALLGGAHTDSR